MQTRNELIRELNDTLQKKFKEALQATEGIEFKEVPFETGGNFGKAGLYINGSKFNIQVPWLGYGPGVGIEVTMQGIYGTGCRAQTWKIRAKNLDRSDEGATKESQDLIREFPGLIKKLVRKAAKIKAAEEEKAASFKANQEYLDKERASQRVVYQKLVDLGFEAELVEVSEDGVPYKIVFRGDMVQKVIDALTERPS